MPPKEERKKGSVKPKEEKSEKEPFDDLEHKVKQIEEKRLITLDIQEFSKWVRQHEVEFTALEKSK